jgi:hypothetical protein
MEPASGRATNVRGANEGNRRRSSGRYRRDNAVVDAMMAGHHCAVEEVPSLAVVTQHLFGKHASSVRRPVGGATHAGATGHTSVRAAGQQSQWGGEQRDDNQNGLSAAHVEPS